MLEVRIPVREDLLLASGQSQQGLEREFRLLIAVKLFELGRVSIGQAAELAGMHKLSFMDELAQFKIPIINLDDDQLEDELRDD